MARMTFGEGLGARPDVKVANIGDRFTDTTTDLVYTFDDGEWKAYPVSPEHNLPEVTSEDNGKTMKVVDGAWAKSAFPTELPEVTAEDNGKVLMVVEGAWAVAALPTE